ncbi:uncharacterized protein LOC119590942 [Penaeus monodon]|uniref:uncharacterized protein LOC119590942 n=1 Tax=Penaeus monodon TaxID=6687 RepID=UPI0018A77A5E|nr:uncharacterized protein LOC119590942 [Penaeus monodon]
MLGERPKLGRPFSQLAAVLPMLGLLMAGAAAEETNATYERMGDVDYVPENSLRVDTHSVSRCAALCNARTACWMFLYARSISQCFLYEGYYLRKDYRDYTLSLYILRGLRKLLGVRDDMGFGQAERFCWFLSGLMHTPRSATEAADFITLVDTYGYTGARKVGGRWVDRRGIDVTDDFSSIWGTNQPNNYAQYLCTTVSSGKIFDVSCGQARPFVCDIDTV